MAQQLKEFDFAKRKRLYPWDVLMDGSIWKLSPEDIYQSNVTNFRAAAYAAAYRRGGKLRTYQEGDFLIIQFYREDD